MKQETGRFWLGVIAGLIVMIPVALVMVNLPDLIPLVSPFIGGLIAGLIAGKGIQNGGKAGIAVGVLGAAVIALDFLIRTGYLQGLTAAFRTLNATLFIIVVVLYSAILAFIGGAIGGYLRP